MFTVGECGLYKCGVNEQAQQIREFFAAPNVEMLPFNLDTADRYAPIRGQHKVAPADAIHLAAAAESRIMLFLTDGRRLKGFCPMVRTLVMVRSGSALARVRRKSGSRSPGGALVSSRMPWMKCDRSSIIRR